MADEEIVIGVSAPNARKVQRDLEALGITYEKVRNQTKSPLGLGDSMLTGKNFSASAKGLDALGNAAQKAGSKARDASTSFLTFDKVIAAIGIQKLVSGMIDLSDTYTNMQNKLATVTSGHAELNFVTQQLSSIAEETRMPMSDLVTIYQRTERAVEGLGKTQAEAFQFAENLSKAIKLSGATGAEASAAIIQLSQAMSLGKLKGQDLNSVLSYSPVVANLIAEKMGVATKELKTLGSEGKITTEVVFDAIKDAAEKVDGPFSKMTSTVEEASIVFKDKLVQEMGRFKPVADTVASAILDLSNNLGTLLDSVEGIAFAMGTTLALVAIPKLITALQGLTAAAIANPWIAAAVAIGAVVGLVVQYREEIGALGKELAINRETETMMTWQSDGMGNMMPVYKAMPGNSFAEMEGNEAADEILSQIAEEEELATLEKLYYDSTTPDLKKNVPDPPKKESGKTFDEMMRGLSREEHMTTFNERDQEVLRGVQQAINSLKPSVRAKIDDNQLIQIEEQIRKTLELKDANEQFHQALKDRVKAGEEAMKEEEERLAAIAKLQAEDRKAHSERMDELARSINPQLEVNDTIAEYQDLMRAQPELTDAVNAKIIELRLSTTEWGQAVTSVATNLKQGFGDAIAQAIVLHKNFGDLIKDLGRMIAMQMISSGVQIGIGAGLSALGIPKFAEGGYTGDMSTSSTAGIVHGKEFVVNADATSRYRPMLEAMNNGGTVSGGAPKVNVHNYAGVVVETSGPSADEVNIMIRKAIREDAPKVVAADMRNQNSQTNRSLRATNQVKGRRV